MRVGAARLRALGQVGRYALCPGPAPVRSADGNSASCCWVRVPWPCWLTDGRMAAKPWWGPRGKGRYRSLWALLGPPWCSPAGCMGHVLGGPPAGFLRGWDTGEGQAQRWHPGSGPHAPCPYLCRNRQVTRWPDARKEVLGSSERVEGGRPGRGGAYRVAGAAVGIGVGGPGASAREGMPGLWERWRVGEKEQG